jgi:hypothetical protein
MTRLLKLFFWVLPGFAFSQTRTITYQESQADILNPERGFYIGNGTRASNFVLLDTNKLRSYRNQPQKSEKASYTVKVSTIMRGYQLDLFKDRLLSDSFLTDLQKDLNTVRAAGLKVILRFAYINKTHSGDCPDKEHICPPYGDAPLGIVLGHIQQLKPVFQKNADVIAALQEGFIGVWGENYYSDYFGDASANGVGRILDSNWLQRNAVLKALLEALPANRMIMVRTPQIKQKFIYGPSATVDRNPIDASAAYNQSFASRIGFHNDCFLSSPDDYGTYYDYGSSSQPKQPARELLRRYAEADTRFTVVGGETCDDAFSPQNDCAPGGFAEEEMRKMHYSFLNAGYNTNVNNDWDSAGCMNSIKRNLGYRLVLKKAVFPAKLSRPAPFKCTLQLDNTGYASPFNPRPVKLVFRNVATLQEYSALLKVNPQLLFPGTHQINLSVTLPADLTAGSYALYLFLPDAAAGLSKRPEYAIQLANEQVWEATTGYNDLHYTIQID